MSTPERPIPQSPELPIAERGPKTVDLIYRFRMTLQELPEFQKQIARSYFGPSDNRLSHVSFDRGDNVYSVAYTASYLPEWPDDIYKHRERLIINVWKKDTKVKEQAVVAFSELKEGELEDSLFSYAKLDSNADLRIREPDFRNTGEALEKIEVILEELQKPTMNRATMR